MQTRTPDNRKLCGRPWIASGLPGLGGGDPGRQRPDGLSEECRRPAVGAEGAAGGRKTGGERREGREGQGAPDRDCELAQVFNRSECRKRNLSY